MQKWERKASTTSISSPTNGDLKGWRKVVVYIFFAVATLLFISTLMDEEKKQFVFETNEQVTFAQNVLSKDDYDSITKLAEKKQEQKQGVLEVNKIEDEIQNIGLSAIAITTPVKSAPKVYICNQFIDSIVERMSDKYNIDKYMIFAIIKQESDFNPKSLSKAGACGLMQLMPNTAKIFQIFGEDIWDEEKNIEGGTRYYRDLIIEFNGNIPFALAGYNAGSNAVKKYGGIPPYKQTKEYVPAVLKHYKNFIIGKG